MKETGALPSDFVAQGLAGDDCDFLANPLVGVEVIAQPGVVLLNDDPGGLLHGLGPDSALVNTAMLQTCMARTSQY